MMKKKLLVAAILSALLFWGVHSVWAQCCGSCGGQGQQKACAAGCTKACCADKAKPACCGSSACSQKKACASGCTKPCCAKKAACGSSCSSGQKKACASGCTKPCSAKKAACCGSCGGGQKKACSAGCSASSCSQKASCSSSCGGGKKQACGSSCGAGACPMQILLAKADWLGLSADQTAQIKSIMAEAEKKVKAVLTPAQLEKAKSLCPKSKGCCGSCGGQAPKKACGSGCTKPCCAKKQSSACCPGHSATPQQTACPIMGLPINKKLAAEYQGKTVYFCCPGCVKKFKANPEKYLSKLPQFQS